MYIHILFIYICINPNMGDGDWRHGISWDHVEIQGQLKKKCIFQGWLKGVTQFYRIFESKALYCSESTRVKVE